MLEEVRQELAKQSWKPELTGVVRNILERYHNVATSTQMVLSKTHEELSPRNLHGHSGSAANAGDRRQDGLPRSYRSTPS